jgi:hypothetical protein
MTWDKVDDGWAQGRWQDNSSSGAIQVRAWIPTDLTNNSLVGWYDASDADNVVTSGVDVTNWKDTSGNGYDMDVKDAGKVYPHYDGSQINGLNVIHYADLNSQLNCPTVNESVSDCIGIFGVGMAKTAGDYAAFGFVRNAAVTDTLEARFPCGPTSGKPAIACKFGGVAYALSGSQSPLLAEETPFLVGAGYDGEQLCCRVNGGAYTVAKDIPDGLQFTINRIQCGRESNTPKNYHGEMLVVRNIDYDTIKRVEGYLAWKWGLETKLPIAHPYKGAAPQIAE